MPQRVFDPTGKVDAVAQSRAPRAADPRGLRLAVLDNTKWNGARLLDAVVERLSRDIRFSSVNRYKKETFTKPAAPELLRDIAANNDVAIIAIAD
jgi:hypothetical protein